MLNETQTPQKTEFEVMRDGKPDPSFKRKQIIKRTRYAISLTRLVIAFYGAKLFKAILRKLDELSKPVRLDAFDHVYNTNLRAQHFSGKRTQAILNAKRSYGLI